MIAIIDYDAGNLKSVEKALQFLGETAVITRDRDVILSAEKVVLPGVGAFGDAMDKLHRFGLVNTIYDVVDKKIPFLGICLGLQLMFSGSEESPGVAGLGLLKGEIVKIPPVDSLKIPHMGWNQLVKNREDRIADGVADGEYAYFVHSYYAVPKNWEDVVYYADYSVRVPGVVRRDNVIGMQFHPEKSSDTGMRLLRNFLKEGEEIAD